jgi:small subunit ribosomal protein S20
MGNRKILGGVSLANTKSAIKAIRVAERKRQINMPIRSGVKTALRRARTAIEQGETVPAEEATRVAVSKLDKAVSKGVLHWRNAARRKSRLMRKLSSASA